ncbi:response regulator [Anaeromyxobacter diazotrophicus]|uniref:histidine kinase n=1 Tax=Anaeromyxobacter diazotrophicus TaxID=2590199 RepID=A0A7I9VG80_9BACT|nr:response regulator [Anaeromyxobacter diazotrophicus]GEJ55401.1 hypothetical protein AMYX_01420 [Anaeromyxobacter diazotrophicus]
MIPVLVVDDSLTVRMDLQEAFSAAGFAPELAAGAGEARAALARRRFALVVLDVLLPDGDGLELLAEIKCSPDHGETPVMLLSSEAEVQHRIRGLQTGADEYVGKPYDASLLVARARELVRRTGSDEPAPPRRPVLVIDDSATAREALRAALEGAGFTVVTADSGGEGLRAAADRRPSAVVVDGVMPGMDGATFIRRLRGDAVLRTTPCILLTAAGPEGEVRALEAGADAYVAKGEGSDPLVLARLEALLRGARPPAELGTAGALAPKRILAVGLGAPPAEAALEELRGEGHDVAVATSLQDALDLLAVDRVDGIVLDATPSLAAALEASRRTQADPARRELPLVLFGPRDEHEAMAAAVEAGADDYVSTARGLTVLRARVHAQLRRKQYEDENRAREAFARNAAILETIADAFFAVDRAWRLVYLNRTFEELLGARHDALLGADLWSSCQTLCGPAAEHELRRAAEEHAPITFETRAGERWFEVRAFPHQGGLSAYLRDVTERRRSQEVQAHLLGIVGHDLRTPLTALSASAALVLRDRALPERHRRALERVTSGAARMSRLISDLLDYSRARLGQGLPVSFRPADLDTLCREAVHEVEAAHPGRTVVYQPQGDGSGVFDPDRMQQVVMNLLTNAVRYGAPGTPVALAWRGQGEERILSVHNEGTPIPPRLREHLFEPFKRGDGAGNSWGGVGLGLYIVGEIVRAHGGRVVVRSDEATGTLFEVTFPARPPARAAPRAGP